MIIGNLLDQNGTVVFRSVNFPGKSKNSRIPAFSIVVNSQNKYDSA